jgi:hypothetical protein
MPQRGYQVGDTVLVRAELLAHGGDFCQIRIAGEDLCLVITTWAPTSEIVKPEHLEQLRQRKARSVR